MKTCPFNCKNGWVFTRHRKIKGIIVRHPHGGVYRFPCRCSIEK